MPAELCYYPTPTGFYTKWSMSLRSPTENEICAQPSSSPPNVLIGGPVRNSPGFPLKACGNDGTGTTSVKATSLFEGD
jgi:hypothetical protein